MSDNSFSLALTEYEANAIKTIENNAAARQAMNFLRELDSKSFGQFILQLTHAAGIIYDWELPVRHDGEDDRSLNMRIEAAYMVRTGETLANLIANSKSWVGVWAGMVLDRGLTLIPEFNADDDSSTLAQPLDNWFEFCGLKRHLTPDSYSRLRTYLLDVHPHLKLYSNKMDEIVKPMLTDDDAGFGITKKVRLAIAAVHEEHKKHKGTAKAQAGISKELSVTLVESFEEGAKHPDKLEAKIAEMGLLAQWQRKYHEPVQVGSWVYTDQSTGEVREDFLIEATGESIEFMRSMFSRPPFVLRPDLGGDSDSRRRKYKDELDQDQGSQE